MKIFSFESIGTKWQIDIYDNIPKSKLEDLKKDIFSFLESFTSTYSRFKKDSLVEKISKNKGRYKFPKSSKEIFSIYSTLYELTGGLFTPLIGSTLDSLGYDKNYSFVPKKTVRPENWEVMDFKYPFLETKKPVLLDFGGCGKGYVIDKIAKIIKKYKIDSFIIDGGGDIYLSNIDTPKIGLENPFDLNQIIGISKVNNASICASALNRRRWDKYSHIINPDTLQSPEDIASVWAISKRALIADSLATALFLVEPEKLTNHFEFEYLILYSDLKIKKSVNFPAEIYYN